LITAADGEKDWHMKMEVRFKLEKEKAQYVTRKSM